MDMGKTITIEISVGELLDRVSLLYIKNSKIKDKIELKEIEIELLRLLPLTSPFLENPMIDDLYTDLMGVNFEIWGARELLKLFSNKKVCDQLLTEQLTHYFELNSQRPLLKEQINKLIDEK